MLGLHAPKTVAIIGAGAMGCLFAARIAEAGMQVTLVDVDQDRLAAIAAQGVRLTDDKGTRTLAVAAARSGDISIAPDLAILFTKSNHSAAAIASIAHWRDASPILLTLQNGIGNAELLAQAFGEDHVVQGTAHIPADLMPPNGVVTHGFGHIHCGGITRKAQDAAALVQSLLQRSGFETILSPQVEQIIWEKLAFNAALNAISMICEATNGEVDNPPGRRIAQAVVHEAVGVAQAKGLTLNAAHILATMDAALREHAHHKPSMLQDRDHGRASEIDAINGAIVREGARLGVATPVCATLADLVRVIELRR